MKLCPFCGEQPGLSKELVEGCCIHDPKRQWAYYVECSCGARGPLCVESDTAKKRWESRQGSTSLDNQP